MDKSVRKDLILVGSLWRKEKKGKRFYSGLIERDGVQNPILIFPAKHTEEKLRKAKEERKTLPDYFICLIDEPRKVTKYTRKEEPKKEEPKKVEPEKDEGIKDEWL